MAISETPGKMYALAAVLSVLAIVAVILRFHSRRLLKAGKTGLDDYMTLLALLFTLGTGVCMVIGAALGDLGRHTVKDADGMPEFTHRTQVFQQTTFASLLTQTLTFGFTKLAVLLFYKRIFTNGRVVYAIQTMLAVVNVWTVAFFLSNLLQCIPISVNWTGWGGAANSCVDTNTMFLAQAWSDVVTDVLILSLPIPSIWRLHLPISQRIGVCSIFLLGGLVVAAGVAKLVAFQFVVAETQTHNDDVTYIMTPTLYWPMIESSLGVVGACLPPMRPLFRDVSLKSIFRSIRSSMKKISGIREKADEGCSKPPTMKDPHKRSANIERDRNYVQPEASTKEPLATYHADRFDDLPDFPSLADNRFNCRREMWADNMV